ncbi:hypothetical protein ACFQO4_05500 [Saliphagus sp. GCM10025334]|uniref:hypothetical protein n=1 Tax=Natronosalvus caseinilyticus TaxID=2953747 RepID=UPI0028B06881|nr:hypothetical protein [Natronosalvus caseinilyticus]
MSEFSDRLLILLMASVTLGSVLIGWVGGFLLPQVTGWGQNVGMAILFVVFVAALIGVWFELKSIDTDRG